MKRSHTTPRGTCWSKIIVVAGIFFLSHFGAGHALAAPPNQQGLAGKITIVDQNGRRVPNARPSATSQIFDVTVGPGGMTVFSPDTLNIAVGDTVRWTWASSNHSVSSGNPCAIDSQFCSPDDMNCPSGVLSNMGTVYQHTFAQAGTYSYFCVAHCDRGMTGTITVAAACTPPPADMVGWWPGDGSARDIQNARNGALQGGATFAPGLVGEAFSFNGASSDVAVTDAPALDPTQQITLDAWVFPTADAGPGDVVSMIVNKELDSSHVQYQIARRNMGVCTSGNGIPLGNFAFFLRGISLPDDCGGWVDGGAQLPLNNWSHIAVTYDGTIVNAYVNGALTRQISTSGPLTTTNGSLHIGARSSLANWAGLIDEVELFSRALSQAEVQSIFNAGTAGKCKPPQPTAAFSRKTQGGAGNFDVDLMPNGTPGIECRSGGASGVYQMIIQFANPVTVVSASLISGNGSASLSSVNGATVTVDLMNVTNAQTIVAKLTGVNDGTLSGDVPVAMSVLLGDTNGNRSVNAGDVAQTKGQSGQAVTAANFREDVNANGSINAGDVAQVKSQSGAILPP